MYGVVKFVIYHGYGPVHTIAARADLSEFEFEELQLTDPQSICIWQFKPMLVVFFGLNSEMYIVNLQALWSNSSTNIFSSLKEIECTSPWVGWLKGCKR
jgi:hypothetical protein